MKKISLVSIGIDFGSAAIILIYHDLELNKKRYRKMSLGNFSSYSDCKFHAEEFQKTHELYLKEIPTILIEKLFYMLQLCLKGNSKPVAINETEKTFDANSDDLNQACEETVRRKKAMMEVEFQRKMVRPGDGNYVYDLRVDFADKSTLPSEWDEQLNDECFWD